MEVRVNLKDFQSYFSLIKSAVAVEGVVPAL